MEVILNGRDLTIEQVVAVAREGAKVVLSEEAKKAVKKAREYVDRKLSEKAIIYGLTTGFGKFSDIFISEDETKPLQKNLIKSHSCGMGDPPAHAHRFRHSRERS